MTLPYVHPAFYCWSCGFTAWTWVGALRAQRSHVCPISATGSRHSGSLQEETHAGEQGGQSEKQSLEASGVPDARSGGGT